MGLVNMQTWALIRLAGVSQRLEHTDMHADYTGESSGLVIRLAGVSRAGVPNWNPSPPSLPQARG